LLIGNATEGDLLDVLDQQSQLFLGFGRPDDKSKNLSKPLLVGAVEDNGVQPAYAETPNSLPIKSVDSNFQRRFPQSELLKKSLAYAKKSRQYPRPLKWVTFDRNKTEQLVLNLKWFNDHMCKMLDTQQLRTLATKKTRTEFQIIQLNPSVQELAQIFSSTKLTMKDDGQRGRYNTNPACAFMQDEVDDPHQQSVHSLATLANVKALNSAIENPALLTNEFIDSIKLTHTPAHYNSENILVWIEGKPYECQSFTSSDPDLEIHDRVKALAILLKENNRTVQFRTPHCLGYFRDTEANSSRFDLVFKKPSGASPSISLHALLSVEMPSLTERIKLMRVLSETLECLHAVNWLHNGLQSSNILFFPNCGSESIEYDAPYISSLEYSNLEMKDGVTDLPPSAAESDIHRHPRGQRSGSRDNGGGANSSGYNKSYDLYSFGIILLEIAYWKPINGILKIPDLQIARQSATLSERLLDDKERLLKHVRSYFGNIVEGVVKACLEGPKAFGIGDAEDQEMNEVAARWQAEFWKRIVRPLGEMSV
jgi:hypothetical protein